MRTSEPQESWPVGVCVFPEPAPNRPRTVAYPDYVDEILLHAGVCCARIRFEDLPHRLDGLRLLVTVGECRLDEETRAALRAWIEAGGGWLSIGGVCGMDEVLGATLAPGYSGWAGGIATLGEGYLVADAADHPVLSHVEKPLHFFNGTGVEPRGARVLASMLDAHGRPDGRATILERSAGRGRALLVAADVTGTIVRVQQGVGVTRDGVPSADGAAPVTDGVLKAGDGAVLDWSFDREPIDGVPGLHGFVRPVADLWREVFLRGVFHLATELRVPLPLLWLYPRNQAAIAHLSHDTDLNEPPNARRLLELLAEANVKSTWCVILPGYDRELIAAIREAGHELAMHYDAMTPGLEWGEAQFDRQWRELTEMFGGERPVTNKNHYLRWEGDVEFWQWCASRGVRLDQSRGASKAGEFAFNFGTCHPFVPVRFDGGAIDVLAMATPTQDLNVFIPEAALRPMLDAVLRHHGILHVLFHPAHVMKPEVAAALLRAVCVGRDHGLEWWTGRQIDVWERARRSVRWSAYRADDDGTASVVLHARDGLDEATVLWLAPRGGDRGEVVRRWGFDFEPANVSLDAGAERELTMGAGR